MDDQDIIQLYWSRNERAIPATAEKYDRYCLAIATNILENPEDAEECVRDAYLHAWSSIPPHRPARLSAFLGKLTRNLAFNRYRYHHADKRGSGEIALVLEELSDCVSGAESPAQRIEQRELISAVNAFLGALPAAKRGVFVRRYWYADSIAAIAAEFGMSETNVSATLTRLRSKLKKYLSERGFEL